MLFEVGWAGTECGDEDDESSSLAGLTELSSEIVWLRVIWSLDDVYICGVRSTQHPV